MIAHIIDQMLLKTPIFLTQLETLDCILQPCFGIVFCLKSKRAFYTNAFIPTT